MTDRRTKWQTATALADAMALSAFAPEIHAATADASPAVIIHEHRTLPVGGLGALTVHVWRRGTEIQVAALDERGAMIVLRSGTFRAGKLSDAAPMQGVLSARTRTISADGVLTVDECESTECAQAVATQASALAAQTTFLENVASRTQRIVVRMCPTADEDATAITTDAHWASEGAATPCRWRVVPALAFAAWPASVDSTLVRVGGTVFRVQRASYRLVHGR